MKRPEEGWRSRVVALWLRHGHRCAPLPALFMVFFAMGPILGLGAAPVHDARHFYAPIQSLVADTVRQGEFAFWDPLMSGGRPLAADPQAAVFSPINLGVGLLTGGDIRGFGVYWLVLWLFAALGMSRWARHQGAPTWANALVSVAFVGCGFFLGHSQHTSVIHSYAFLPWILWRLDVSLLTGSLRAAAQAGALWGLSALAGYPGMTMWTALFVTFWSVARAGGGLIHGQTRWNEAFARVTGSGFVMLGVGLVVLAPSYIGFLVDGAGYSERTGELERDMVINNSPFPPAALQTLFTPLLGALKILHEPELWPGSFPSMVNVFFGVAIPALAAAGLLTRPRRAFPWLVLGVSLFFLAGSLSSTLPIRGWLYDYLPPTRYFRQAGMLRGFALFGLCVLALNAARDLSLGALTPRARRRARLAAAWAATLYGVALVYIVIKVERQLEVPEGWSGVALAVGLSASVATAAAFFSRRRLRVVGWVLVIFACMEVGYAVRQSKISIDYGPSLEQWRSLEQARSQRTKRIELWRWPRSRRLADVNNDNLYLRKSALRSYDPMADNRFLRWTQHPVLTRLVTGRARFWFCSNPARLPPSERLFNLLQPFATAHGQIPLVVHQAPFDGDPLAALRQACKLEPVDLKQVVYRPRRMAFVVEVPDNGWLWITDRWARGWTTRVDGEVVPTEKGNLYFRAIEVKAGRRHVVSTYRPWGHPWLLLLSWGTLAAVTLAAPLSAWRRRRFRDAEENPARKGLVDDDESQGR